MSGDPFDLPSGCERCEDTGMAVDDPRGELGPCPDCQGVPEPLPEPTCALCSDTGMLMTSDGRLPCPAGCVVPEPLELDEDDLPY